MSVPDNDSHPQRAVSFYEATPRRPAREDHSGVALALARFEQRVAASVSPRRLRLSGVWAACALLTTAAFVGGLLLARYPFVAPEAPITVTSRAPELMYLPPAEAAGAVFADLNRGSALAASSSPTLALANPRSAATSDDLPEVTPPRTFDRDTGTGEAGDLNLRDLAGAWGEAARFASIRQWEGAFSPTDPAQHGYAGLELSAIPEPSTSVVVAVGLATLLAWSHRARRRPRT